MEKIDKRLITSVVASSIDEISCFVFAENIERAKDLFNKFEVKILAEYPFVNLLYVFGKLNTICRLSNHNVIKYISSQSNVEALVNISKQVLNLQTNSTLTGKNVGVCYIDTGVHSHLDFCLGKNRIIKFVDLIEKRNQPYDDNGHGTFVCGVGSGSGLVSNFKFSGFAPQSNIISIKALNCNGEATANKILEAMQWVYSNHKQYDIKVVCMSFGSEPLGYNDPIMKGAEMLWKCGICVVAAAGNSGPSYETIKSPGVSNKIITVGGINDNRFDDNNFNKNFFEVAKFSSRGPALKRFKPDLVAPSVDINSCLNSNKFYTKLSGTSVATPMVAGICALAFEKNKNLKPDNIKRALLQSCTPITFNKNFEGFGLLNAGKFLSIV